MAREFVETYCSCDIYKTLQPGGSYLWDSPCTTYMRFDKARVRKDIESAGYCGAPDPPAGQGSAKITVIDLPDSLDAGEYIIGSVTIKNVGDIAAPMRIDLTTEWDGTTYGTGYDGSLDPGDTLTGGWSGPAVKMPNETAIITIKALRKKDGVWITDDTKSH